MRNKVLDQRSLLFLYWILQRFSGVNAQLWTHNVFRYSWSIWKTRTGKFWKNPNCFSSPSRTSLQILDHFTPHRVKPPQLSNKFFHLRFLIHNQILTFATCSKCRGYEIKTFMIARIMDAFFLLYPFLSTSHVLHLFLLTLKYNSN